MAWVPEPQHGAGWAPLGPHCNRQSVSMGAVLSRDQGGRRTLGSQGSKDLKCGAACITHALRGAVCAPWQTQHPCVYVFVVCCPAGQVQVWDTQDEESMDPLLNISDGFDAEVRGGSGALGFRVQIFNCLCAGVKQQTLTPAQLTCKQAAGLVCWGGARQELASQERGAEPCCPCGM